MQEVTNPNYVKKIIVWIIVLIIIVIAKKMIDPPDEIDVSFPESSLVKHFGLELQIADLPNKHYEGGFHLYFHSPLLKIRRLISYRFDSGQTIKAVFDLEGRRITPQMFHQAMESSYLKSHSNNIYNASRVRVYGVISGSEQTDYYFKGSKQLNPQLDRNLTGPHVYLKGINYQITHPNQL